MKIHPSIGMQRIPTFFFLRILPALCCIGCFYHYQNELTYTCDTGRPPVFNEVRTIFSSTCAVSGCHVSTNTSIPSLESAAEIRDNLGDCFFQIDRGAMPPKGSKPLSTFEKSLIMCWIQTGGK